MELILIQIEESAVATPATANETVRLVKSLVTYSGDHTLLLNPDELDHNLLGITNLPGCKFVDKVDIQAAIAMFEKSDEVVFVMASALIYAPALDVATSVIHITDVHTPPRFLAKSGTYETIQYGLIQVVRVANLKSQNS